MVPDQEDGLADGDGAVTGDGDVRGAEGPAADGQTVLEQGKSLGVKAHPLVGAADERQHLGTPPA